MPRALQTSVHYADSSAGERLVWLLDGSADSQTAPGTAQQLPGRVRGNTCGVSQDRSRTAAPRPLTIWVRCPPQRSPVPPSSGLGRWPPSSGLGRWPPPTGVCTASHWRDRGRGSAYVESQLCIRSIGQSLSDSGSVLSLPSPAAFPTRAACDVHHPVLSHSPCLETPPVDL